MLLTTEVLPQLMLSSFSIAKLLFYIMYKVEKIFFSGEKMSNVRNLLFFVTCLTDYWTFLLNISQLKCCFAEKMCIFAKSKVHFVMKEWKFIISCVPWIIIKLKTNQRSKVRQRALAGNLLIICSNMEQVFSYIISLGASVMMPIIFTVIGLCIGMKFGKALKSGLFVGVGFVGLGVVTALLTKNFNDPLKLISDIYHLQLNV